MKISVIITTYNRAALVEQTVASVLDQSCQDFELIVVDDGSSDSTAQTLARFGDRIRYVRQPNSGLSHARNQGLSLARGDYIAILDDDDLWQPYKLALQLQIMERFPELAFTFSNFAIYRSPDDIQYDGIQSWFPEPVNWQTLFDDSIPVSELSDPVEGFTDNDSRLYFGKIYHASLSHYYVLPSSALFRRDSIPDGVRFAEHDAICGDWEFFARLSRDRPVAYLDHETTFNRSHEDAVRLTRTPWKQQLECRIDMLERLYLQDDAFYRQHRADVDSVYGARLLALYRQKLLHGEHGEARQTVDKIRRHSSPGSLNVMLLYSLCYIPGISQVLRLLRQLRG